MKRCLVEPSERIDNILALIEQLWINFPDQRLGQLLTNFGWKGEDIYNFEDDELEKNLRETLENRGIVIR